MLYIKFSRLLNDKFVIFVCYVSVGYMCFLFLMYCFIFLILILMLKKLVGILSYVCMLWDGFYF